MIGSMALALAVAEGGRRVLSPRSGTIEPSRVDLGDYFSSEEIDRGARFARPQLALGIGRAVVDLAALAAIVRRPPRGRCAGDPSGRYWRALRWVQASALPSRSRRCRLRRSPAGARSASAWRRSRGAGGRAICSSRPAIETILTAVGQRGGRVGDATLSARVVASGGGGLGRVRRAARGARPGRARSGVQRLHPASRGRDPIRRARAGRRPPE